MATFNDAHTLETLMAKVGRSVDVRGLSLGQLSQTIGVSAAFLKSCLEGRRSMAPTRLVQLCREAGIEFPLVANAIEGVIQNRNYLRSSTAAKTYECSYCGAEIKKRDQYIRLEPFAASRQSGAPVQHFCSACAVSARWLSEPGIESPGESSAQLEFPLSSVIKATTVRLIDVSASLCEKIAAHPEEIFSLSASKFESLILDRLSAMGFSVYQVGGQTYRKDGGIDIVFTPPKSYPFPFLGAAQVKHRLRADRLVGPGVIRELAGVMAAKGIFSAGLIVTNTTFTPDAKAFARESHQILRLRDYGDLMRWVQNNFTDDAEWREIPRRIKLCEGVFVDLE